MMPNWWGQCFEEQFCLQLLITIASLSSFNCNMMPNWWGLCHEEYFCLQVPICRASWLNFECPLMDIWWASNIDLTWFDKTTHQILIIKLLCRVYVELCRVLFYMWWTNDETLMKDCVIMFIKPNSDKHHSLFLMSWKWQIDGTIDVSHFWYALQSPIKNSYFRSATTLMSAWCPIPLFFT